jgi:hypothetical protein
LSGSLVKVYRLLQRGELPIPVLRLGRSPRVRVADLEHYLAEMADDERERRPVSTFSRHRRAI